MSWHHDSLHTLRRRRPVATAPRRSKKTLIAAVGIGMALALSGCNDDNGGTKDGADGAKDEGARATQPKSPSAGSSASSGSSSAPASPAADKPLVAGWQTQTRDEHHFRYDVPAKAEKWKVFNPDVSLSYNDENGKPIVVMTGAANYRQGGCASSPNPKAFGEAGKGQLATVGTTGGGTDGSLQENARNWAGNWGFVAYGGKDNKPKIEVSQAKPWKRNGIEGYTATAKVTVVNRPSSCVPPRAIVHSIAQKLPDGTMHGWVIYADQGVPHALTSAEIDKIMNTVRPTDG
ncbi:MULTISPECIES: hypothetical protein [unclassified Streptomyces]|uniref:hypothetical protein n=1 Tax=unclassified Streptomyces TaxID=2593676 RepID=UPI00336A3817